MKGANTVDLGWDTGGISHLLMDRKCLCFRKKKCGIITGNFLRAMQSARILGEYRDFAGAEVEFRMYNANTLTD